MFFLIFFFLNLLVVHTHQASDLATQTCDKLTSVKELCKTALGTSTATDMEGFVKASLAATTRVGGDVSEQIAQMLMSEASTAQESLTKCASIYKAAMDELKNSTAALNEKAYADVEVKLTEAMTTSKACEDGFKGASPLTEQNNKFRDYCNLTLDIIKTIKV